jgi:hypothetical protein
MDRIALHTEYREISAWIHYLRPKDMYIQNYRPKGGSLPPIAHQSPLGSYWEVIRTVLSHSKSLMI